MKKVVGIIGLVFILFCFVNYQLYSREIVYLHLNKKIFISGEQIRFKAYLIDENAHTSVVKSRILYLQLSNYENQNLFVVRSDIEEDGTGYGLIDLPDSLGTGLYYLTAFTNCMRNYNQELLQSLPVIVINPRDENIDSLIYLPALNSAKYQSYNQLTEEDNKSVAGREIATDKNIYGKREKVVVSIKLEGLQDTSSTANISITVTEHIPSDNLLNYGQSIQYCFSLLSKNLQEIKGWTDLNRDIQNCRYLREDEGYILSGTVFNNSSGVVFPDACVLLSTSDTIANLKYNITDSSGKFYFLLDKCYNNKDLVLQIKDPDQSLKNAGIKIDEKSIGTSFSHVNKISMDDSLKSYLKNCRAISIINKSYRIATDIPEIPEKNICMMSGYDFFGVPDKIIYPSDFTELPDFHEIISNIIPGVKYKLNEDNTYSVQLLNNDSRIYMSEKNALVLMNNIPVFDYGILKRLNSKQLKQIKIKQKMMMYGDLEISGVLSLITGEDYLPLLQSENKIHLVNNTVIYRNKGVIDSDYKNEGKRQSKIPDLRQTLYWNPEIKIDKNVVVIEFYASDIKATYNINIQGITHNGVPISATTRFKVQ